MLRSRHTGKENKKIKRYYIAAKPCLNKIRRRNAFASLAEFGGDEVRRHATQIFSSSL